MTPPPSDHFNGKTFFYPGPRISGRFRDFLRWRFSRRPARWPRWVELAPQPPPPARRGDEIVATWIGHATWLLQTAGGNFLTDPQFSPCAGPLGRIGPRRVHAPGLAFDALPRIDVVLLSHDHYDHCDLPSLKRLASAHDPLFVAPLRHDDLLQSAGARRVASLDWWQTHTLDRGARVTCVPSKHWANRLGTPRNHRLWSGFMLELGRSSGGLAQAEERRVWFVGDTGYDENLFRTIGRRYGAPDLALIPIGAYEPRWFMTPMHMNPAEAVATHRDVGARRSLAMHWGTFQLTDEAREDPVRALAAARAAAGLADNAFQAVEPGVSVVV
jgi:L-ascorbate metabolism protein UlaG (beta-lactamase superfamily)